MWLHSAALGARSPGPWIAAIKPAMSAAAASSRGCLSSCRQVRDRCRTCRHCHRTQADQEIRGVMLIVAICTASLTPTTAASSSGSLCWQGKASIAKSGGCIGSHIMS